MCQINFLFFLWKKFHIFVKYRYQLRFKIMTKEKINDMVDRIIIDMLNSGKPFYDVKFELLVRLNNFIKIIDKYDCNYDELYHKEFDEIDKARERYGITYIKHSQKRIKDIDWVMCNMQKFHGFNAKKMFQLVRLKDKLS